MAAAPDYRVSHSERGPTYDATLAQTPFDAYMAEWERRHLVRIVAELFPCGPRRYLDFACGTGRITGTVAPMSKVSLGVDISASMIDEARRKLPGVEFHQCDLTTSERDFGKFDLVTAFRFFGNAQPELREGAMRAIADRMLPGGWLMINSHRNPFALYAILDRLTGGVDHGMDLHIGKVRDLLGRHGLSVRHMFPIGAWMFRSRMLQSYRPDDDVAVANERRFSHSRWSALAPDVIVVAQRV